MSDSIKQSASPRYDGSAVVELLDEGRRVKLVNDFGYIDQYGSRWDVPAGAIVDGASIPRVLWSIIGGPFEGPYRIASVIHDWFCDLRTRPWRAVHRMFYEAMVVSGVAHGRAALMYGGVYWGGPRWSATVEHNLDLLLSRHRGSSDSLTRAFHMRLPAASGTRYRYAFGDEDVAALAAAISASDLSIDKVESYVDCRLAAMQRIDY